MSLLPQKPWTPYGRKHAANVHCRLCMRLFDTAVGRDNHERLCEGTCPRCSAGILAGSLQQHLVQCQPDQASARRTGKRGRPRKILPSLPPSSTKEKPVAPAAPKKHKRKRSEPITPPIMTKKKVEAEVQDDIEYETPWPCPLCLSPFPSYCLMGMHLQIAHGHHPKAHVLWVSAWEPDACCHAFPLECCTWAARLGRMHGVTPWPAMDTLVATSRILLPLVPPAEEESRERKRQRFDKSNYIDDETKYREKEEPSVDVAGGDDV